MTALTFWAMKTLSVDRVDLLFEMPLNSLILWARQDQYVMDDKVMTLGDKDLIDKLNQTKRG